MIILPLILILFGLIWVWGASYQWACEELTPPPPMEPVRKNGSCATREEVREELWDHTSGVFGGIFVIGAVCIIVITPWLWPFAIILGWWHVCFGWGTEYGDWKSSGHATAHTLVVVMSLVTVCVAGTATWNHFMNPSPEVAIVASESGWEDYSPPPTLQQVQKAAKRY